MLKPAADPEIVQKLNQVKKSMSLLKRNRNPDQSGHRVSDQKALLSALVSQSTKKMSKPEALRLRLPPRVILGIVQHLAQVDTLRFAALCRYVRETILYEAKFEGQWVIKSFHSLLSKAGYCGIRNNYLRLIDIRLRNMHFQAKSLAMDCKDEQWYIFGVWWRGAFVMYFVVTPIMLIFSYSNKEPWPTFVLFIPCLVSWLGLLLAQVKISLYVKSSLAHIRRLHLSNKLYLSLATK